MKTEEFIGRVEALECVAKTEKFINQEIDIRDKQSNMVASVDLAITHDISIYKQFRKLSKDDQDALFDLLVEFAKTPIEEREEKKEYYIRFSGVGIPGWNRYLNQLFNKEVFFADNGENSEVKTKFTDDEISELPTWVIDMLNDGYLVKEEV